jgi:aspartyl-tRNA(Asn)/glutamyl-tRNA(Gln) amidotransferase subunit B
MQTNLKLYPIIGLEIHVQLNTKTKLFCHCLNEYAPDKPNKNICPFCTGQPGALPAINKEAVKKAIKFGQAIKATIPEKTRWDRKNYFYPDLPSGYQISQYDNPIVEGGSISFYIEDKNTGQFTESTVEMTRAHLESDAAKLMHIGGKTMVDFNRSGAPLIEIVTEPVIQSSAQAMAFVNELQNIVRSLGVSDADMDKGQMRFDCNLSLRSQEEYDNGKLPNYRTETKNINSIRSLGRAIEYEIVRQTKLLEEGIRPTQETRGWKDDQNKSVSQRSKEDAMDYRYFPEPDLQILSITQEDLIPQDLIPKLPHVIRQELISKGLSPQIANTIIENKTLIELFNDLNNGKNTKTLANILTGSLLAKANFENKSINAILTTRQIGELVNLVLESKISNQNIIKIIDLVQSSTDEVENIASMNNYLIVNDTSMLSTIVDKVIMNNTAIVEEYKGGKTQVIGYLLGQCMKEAKGQGNPKIFTDLIKEKIG